MQPADLGAILEPLCLNVDAEGLLEVKPLPQLLKLGCIHLRREGPVIKKKKVKMFLGSEISLGVGVSGLLWENVRGSGNDDSSNSVQAH